MRAVVQRVSEASVEVAGSVTGQIAKGLLIFLGVRYDDGEEQAAYLARKISQLRIFPDETGKMNLSVQEAGGELLIVSQFTLYAETRKGNRPSYSRAANAEAAKRLYDYFVAACRAQGLKAATGVFQADMRVRLTNDGPVTLICDSGD